MQNLIINIGQAAIKPVSNVPLFLTQRILIQRKALLIVTSVMALLSSHSPALGREVHGTHAHGVADLTLAFEKGFLEIELESPAMSFLGFEHEPKNAEQIEIVKRAKETLSSANKVVAITGGDCTSSKAKVDIHGPAGHFDEHETDEHKDHDSDESHGKNHDGAKSHSEVSASYLFSCDAVSYTHLTLPTTPYV